MQRRPPPSAPARGFTLVELLVALFIMSLVAILSWRGLDGMARAQSATQERADKVLALQVGLAQWNADLEALITQPQLPALEWNGRVLRILRRAPAAGEPGVVVTAWASRTLDNQVQWLRWQSPVLARRDQVLDAWQRADTWSQNAGEAERAREVAVVPLAQWQLFFFRGNAWTNPLSSDASAPQGMASGGPQAAPGSAAAPQGQLPEGIRLVLTLPAGHPMAGTLTSDWVSPRVAGGRS